MNLNNQREQSCGNRTPVVVVEPVETAHPVNLVDCWHLTNEWLELSGVSDANLPNDPSGVKRLYGTVWDYEFSRLFREPVAGGYLIRECREWGSRIRAGTLIATRSSPTGGWHRHEIPHDSKPTNHCQGASVVTSKSDRPPAGDLSGMRVSPSCNPVGGLRQDPVEAAVSRSKSTTSTNNPEQPNERASNPIMSDSKHQARKSNSEAGDLSGLTQGASDGRLPVAIYARAATRAPSERQGLAAQIERCRDYADEAGWCVVSVYSDLGQSGTKRARPELDELLADARAGRFETVLVYDFERLARDARLRRMLVAELGTAGIALVAASGQRVAMTSDERSMLALLVAADDEARQPVRRRRRGLTQRGSGSE